jgi:SAM-dependent methyltransferase
MAEDTLPSFACLPYQATYPFLLEGICPICASRDGFCITKPYYRNTVKCLACGSLPRHRALYHELGQLCQDWPTKAIHECSPGWDAVSQKLARECEAYVATHYDRTLPPGSIRDTQIPCKQYRCEDIENQSFGDNIFDIIVMQDIFEHIFDPHRAIAEIERTLRPGGSLIMTVPIVRGYSPSQRRAYVKTDNTVVHLLDPEFHGNPIDSSGSLVTIDWGYDLSSFISRNSGLSAVIRNTCDVSKGIIGSLTDVVIASKKLDAPNPRS